MHRTASPPTTRVARFAALLLACALTTLAARAQGTATDLLADADARLVQGDYTGALDLYTRALDLDPELAAGYRGRGEANEQLDNLREALADLNRALYREPEDHHARFARGRIYAGLERWDDALKDLEPAAKTFDEDPEVLTWCAYAHYWLDRNLRARRLLRKAIELDPPMSWPLALLADIEVRMRKGRDALEHVEAAIALDADIGWYHWTRGEALALLGDGVESQAAFGRALELDPELEQELAPDEPPLDPDVEALLPLVTYAGLLVLVLGLLGLVTARGAWARARDVRHELSPAGYDGDAKELFRLYLENVVLTVLTLGVYRFWAKVKVRRYRYQHTTFLNGRFDYHVLGREKFVGFLKGLVILSPLVGLLYLAYGPIEAEVGEETALTVCGYLFVLLLYFLRPLILVGAQRFNLRRTSWNNLRFHFTGRLRDAYGLYLLDLFLIAITLGIYTYWHRCKVRAFRLGNTYIGDAHFGYRGTGRELLNVSLGGWILTWLTLGFYLPWYLANVHRFHVKSTTFRGRRFRTSLTGRAVLGACAPALLASVLTLGLALPWAIHRWYTVSTRAVWLPKKITEDDLSSVRTADDASSLTEGIGEAGEILGEIGDLFGA